MILKLSLFLALILPIVALATPDPGSSISNRPGSERLTPPKLLPKQKNRFFELPTVEQTESQQITNEPSIQLNAVKFIGNTVIDDTELQKIAKHFVGRVVTVSELEELRQQITELYISKGYVNSGTIIPQQKFQQGIIQYQIIEGTLDDIEITGNEWLQKSYIRQRLQAGSNIFKTDEPVFNIDTLRQRFQLLLTDPLIDRMQGKLLPGVTPGQGKLVVDIKRARAYQLSLSYDNYRPPSVGAEHGQLSGYVHNLTGFGDIIDATLSLSEGIEDASGGISIPLNAYNTRFSFRFYLSKTKVIEESLKALDIESRFSSYDFGLTQPLYQSLTQNINTGITLSTRKNRTTLFSGPFSFSAGAVNGETKVTALRMHLDYSKRSENQVFSARVAASVGIDAFDATILSNDKRPDGDFLVWLGQLQYIRQIMSNGTLLALRGDLQYAEDKLLPLERFALGGTHSVRGYRENEVVRDNGYVISAEFRYPLDTLLPKNNYIGQIELVPFMDYGAGWNRGGNGKTYLHSIGIGLQWQPVSRFNAEIFYAHDLITATNKADYNLQDSGLHFRVSISAF